MEESLIWLLDSEEKIIDVDLLKNNLEAMKQAFYEHEKLADYLYNNQEAILKLLDKSQFLIKSHICEEEKKKEIFNQQTLIKKHWDELRNKVLSVRTEIHETLMSLEQKQINDFRNWLTEAEDKISRLPVIGPDLETIKLQLKEHAVSLHFVLICFN